MGDCCAAIAIHGRWIAAARPGVKSGPDGNRSKRSVWNTYATIRDFAPRCCGNGPLAHVWGTQVLRAMAARWDLAIFSGFFLRPPARFSGMA